MFLALSLPIARSLRLPVVKACHLRPEMSQGRSCYLARRAASSARQMNCPGPATKRNIATYSIIEEPWGARFCARGSFSPRGR